MKRAFPRLATTPVDCRASRIQVLSAGPWQLREFEVALRDVAEARSWHRVDGVDEAADYLDASIAPPELIVLAQPLPGHYRQPQIDRLQRQAPLARIVVVAGTWCEGEVRTGKPLAGVLRLYWHEFAPWWAGAIRRLAQGLCPPWSVPLDSASAGRCLSQPVSHGVRSRATIAISAHDYSVYAALAEALPGYGLSAAWVHPSDAWQPTRKFRGGIWDGSQLDAQEYHQLQEFCRAMESLGGLVVALLDFPRVEHRTQASQAGAKAVFGKPYVVAEIADVFR